MEQVKIQDLLDDWSRRQIHLGREIAFLESFPGVEQDRTLNELRGLSVQLNRLLKRYGFDS